MDPVLIGEILSVTLFFGVIGFLMLGFPVAFTLAGVSLLFAGIGYAFGVFDPRDFGFITPRWFGYMTNEVLVAVPLFVFMGVVLERSKIAEALLETMGKLFGSMRGGLGLSVIIVGALLAASTGVVGATVVTMGLLSLPAMLRAGYSPKLASGIICASGTLGQIIPPSTVLIFMGDIIQGANAEAQRELGNFAPSVVSVGDLFAGAFIPGLSLVVLYLLYTLIVATFRPKAAPALVMTAEDKANLGRDVLVSLLPPFLLIIAVLGSILAGVATPTESASVGAVGAMVLAALNRQLNYRTLRQVMVSTMQISSMVFIILFGASLFALVFRTLGGDVLLEEFLAQLPGGAIGAMLFVMILMFVLGFILDTFEIIFIVMPLTAPILLKMGIDPVWLGVIIGVNLQTSFLTPPVGFSLFYLRSVAPREVKTTDIYKGVAPFVLLQITGIALLWFFPQLATWLPSVVFG
ncbi:TRAP transporter large permease subunit [Inquilinus sp. CAU 1745]|uniref:TRAP transporter large permease n=1 Tax=Inquilinus sp. CAU 1745 TaxID=3140369 RepID=UPI00325B4D9D